MIHLTTVPGGPRFQLFLPIMRREDADSGLSALHDASFNFSQIMEYNLQEKNYFPGAINNLY